MAATPVLIKLPNSLGHMQRSLVSQLMVDFSTVVSSKRDEWFEYYTGKDSGMIEDILREWTPLVKLDRASILGYAY